MDITSIPNSLAAADVPPEQLAGDPRLSEDQKIGEVARQFEAILLREILQASQKTVISSEFTDNSTAAGIYQDMVSRELADSISKSGTMGLAHMLQRQLTRQLHPASVAGHNRSAEAQPTSPSAADRGRPHFPVSPFSARAEAPHTHPVSSLTPHEATPAPSH